MYGPSLSLCPWLPSQYVQNLPSHLKKTWEYLVQRSQNLSQTSLFTAVSCRSTFLCTKISAGEQINWLSL